MCDCYHRSSVRILVFVHTRKFVVIIIFLNFFNRIIIIIVIIIIIIIILDPRYLGSRGILEKKIIEKRKL